MQKQPEEFVAGLVATVLARAGRCRLRVGGTSMRPAIRPGDTLCVRRVELSEIGVGDVVLFSRAQRLFAHRVVHVADAAHPSEWHCTTRGDANEDCDPPVAGSQILGRVASVHRVPSVLGALRALLASRFRASVA